MALPAPVVEYDFLRSDCLRNEMEDSRQNPLGSLRTEASVRCPSSNGAFLHYASERNTSVLQRQLFNFTVEIWYRQSVMPSSGSQPLVFLMPTSSQSGAGTTKNRLEIQQLAASNNKLQMYALLTRSIGDSMAVSPEFSIETINGKPQMLHLCVSFVSTRLATGNNELRTQFFLNGVKLSETFPVYSPFSFMPMDWDTTSILHILPQQAAQAAPSNITIHKLAIYSKGLSLDETSLLYRAGIRNSLPVVSNQTVTVLENGVLDANNPDPAYYSDPPANTDLPVLSLPVFDLEDDTSRAWTGAPMQASDRVKIYLESLPVRGWLYYLNGTQLPSALPAQVPYNQTLQSYSVRYRPPWNSYSSSLAEIFTSLEFRAVDGITGEQALRRGRVDIVVQKVVKPPVATALTRQVQARRSAVIALTGLSETGSTTQKAFIRRLPYLGKLYSVSKSTSQKTEIVPSLLDSFILDQAVADLVYYYTGTEQLVNKTSGFLASDNFTFGVLDNQNRKSLVSLAVVRVQSAIAANTSRMAWSTSEGQSSTVFQILGIDEADNTRSLSAYMVSPPQHGSVLETTALLVRYQADSLYFNTPNRTWDGQTLPFLPEYIQYGLRTDDGAESPYYMQSIVVKNKNDPTTLSFHYPQAKTRMQSQSSPAEQLVVYALTGSPSDEQYSTLTFQSFSVDDPDRGVDPVKVQISAQFGLLSLNQTALEQHHQHILFNSQLYCPSGSCIGNGNNDRKMTFVTTPSILQSLLAGMTYTCLTPDVMDNVTITVLDGVGAPCLPAQVMGSRSVFDACYSTTVDVQIQVLEYYTEYVNDAGASNLSLLSINLQYTALALLVLLLLLVIKYCCCDRCSRKPRARRETRAKHGEEEDLERGTRARPPESERKGTPPASSGQKKKTAEKVRVESEEASKPAVRTRTETAPSLHKKDKLDKRVATVRSASRRSRNFEDLADQLEKLKQPHKAYSQVEAEDTEEEDDNASDATHEYAAPATRQPAAAAVPQRIRVVDASTSAKSVWSAHRHSSGKVFYYNNKTRKSTWKRPEEFI